MPILSVVFALGASETCGESVNDILQISASSPELEHFLRSGDGILDGFCPPSQQCLPRLVARVDYNGIIQDALEERETKQICWRV